MLEENPGATTESDFSPGNVCSEELEDNAGAAPLQAVERAGVLGFRNQCPGDFVGRQHLRNVSQHERNFSAGRRAPASCGLKGLSLAAQNFFATEKMAVRPAEGVARLLKD